MRTMNPIDPSTLPASGATAPTQGQGTAFPSGLTNQCGALYFLNKSNTGVQLLFEDGNYTILPAWFARVYVLKNKSNQLWFTKAYTLNNTAPGTPISQLYWETYQQGEDTTGLYNGPLTYQTSIGGGALSQATQVIQTGQVVPTAVVSATPSPSFIGLTEEAVINNDGSAHFGQISVHQFVSWDNVGNENVQSLTEFGGGITVSKTPILATGNQESGYCGASLEVGGSVASAVGPTTNFKSMMTNVPSSITLGTPIENSGASAPAAADINKFGFWMTWTATTINSLSRYTNTYTTGGN